MRSFAQSLRADLPAVRAAFKLPWSNGQTEGHVNRLKFLKRQMYGRANIEWGAPHISRRSRYAELKMQLIAKLRLQPSRARRPQSPAVPWFGYQRYLPQGKSDISF
ncbi:hypothetical protein RM96_22765 [Cupriavidus sp. IDO]|nr:hypothetical protein RM96_22765 [Cupriavidus sp. IDO]